MNNVSTKLRPDNWYPMYWWVFLLLGPYGAEVFGVDLHANFSIYEDAPPIRKRVMDFPFVLPCRSYRHLSTRRILRPNQED
jgi:hypothetical protein